MPRQPRFWYLGAALHAIRRGNNRVAVFHGDQALTDDELREIPDATQFEWALGGEDFLRCVEAVTGRRTARLPMGPRPGSLRSNDDLPSE